MDEEEQFDEVGESYNRAMSNSSLAFMPDFNDLQQIRQEQKLTFKVGIKSYNFFRSLTILKSLQRCTTTR